MDISERKTLTAQIERATDKMERLESAIKLQTAVLDDSPQDTETHCACGAPIIDLACADIFRHCNYLVQRIAALKWALWELRSMVASNGQTLESASAVDCLDGREIECLKKCKCNHIFGEHEKPKTDISWDVCSFPCLKCDCSEFETE